jgi:hypothetical protein
MSCLPGQRDRDWSHIPRAPAQLAESVSEVLRSPPKAQSGEVSTLAEKVWHLRHIVSPEGITTNPWKLKAVREWPMPKK